MYNVVVVTVVYTFQDLLDTVRSICLTVEFSGHNVLKQLSSRHPELTNCDYLQQFYDYKIRTEHVKS